MKVRVFSWAPRFALTGYAWHDFNNSPLVAGKDILPSFKEIIHVALKNPDANYSIRKPVYTLPAGETKQSRVLKSLKEKSVPARHVVMGFGGLFTFDLAVASNSPPEGVLLCDINTTQGAFWDAFLELVKECGTASALRKRFTALPEQRADLEIDLPQQLKPKVLGNVSLRWIYNEEEYQTVRALVLQDKVAHITLDCMDTERYTHLKKVLDDNNLSSVHCIFPTYSTFSSKRPEGFTARQSSSHYRKVAGISGATSSCYAMKIPPFLMRRLEAK